MIFSPIGSWIVSSAFLSAVLMVEWILEKGSEETGAGRSNIHYLFLSGNGGVAGSPQWRVGLRDRNKEKGLFDKVRLIATITSPRLLALWRVR